MRYSPMSNWSLEVALRVVPPVTPVLDCQVTVQLVVAVMGQVPVPPVRSLRDRQWNWWPQGGSAFQSNVGGGWVPAPWQVMVAGLPCW